MATPLENLQRSLLGEQEYLQGIVDPERRRRLEESIFQKQMQIQRMQGTPWSGISGLRYGPPTGHPFIPSVTGYGTSYDAVPTVGSVYPGDTGGAWADMRVDVMSDGMAKVTNTGPETAFTEHFRSKVESGEMPLDEARAKIAHSKREKGVSGILAAEKEVSELYGTPTPREDYTAATKAFQAEKAAIPAKANLGDINVDDPYDPTGKRAKAGIAGVDFSGKFSRALGPAIGLGLGAALAPEEVWAAPFSQEGLQYGLESATGISPAGLVSDPRDYAPWSGGVARDVVGGLGQLTRDVLETRDVQPGEPYSGMGDAPNKFDAGHPGMMGVTDVTPTVTTTPYSEAGVPMSNENLSFFGAAPVPTSPSMRDVDYSQALADAGMATVPEISIPDRYMESDKRDYETQEEADARNIEVARDRQDIMRHLDVVYGTNHSGDVTGPIYDDGRQDILGNLSKEDIIDLPDWVRDIALNIHDNVTKTEILAPHIDVGTTQENIQDIINNTVGINLRNQGFDYNTALNSPNIATKDSVSAAAALAKDKAIDLAESLPEMISQVDTFKDIPASVPVRRAPPVVPAYSGPTKAELKAAAAAQRKADLAEKKAAARRTELARQALKDSQAAAARAQAASEKQAKAAQAKARALLDRAASSDRSPYSEAEINAAREVLSQIDTFASGGMMTDVQRAMTDVGYGGGFAAGRGDTGATGQGGWT